MKVVYISYVNEEMRTGFRDKIYAQAHAFSKLGAKTYLIGRKKDSFYLARIFDKDKNETILQEEKYTFRHKGFMKSLNYMLSFPAFVMFCRFQLNTIQPQMVYIRRIRPINPWILSLIKYAKNNKITVLYEYPTYPWKKELFVQHQYATLIIELILFRSLVNRIDALVCMGKCNIKGCDVIETMNGMISNDILLHTDRKLHSNSTVRFICVANYVRVHGLEKIIHGFQSFYKKDYHYNVELHLVGDVDRFKPVLDLANSYGLGKYIKTYGYVTGKELDDIYELVDIGIDAIALELRGEECICGSLKSREYISRGLPFICSDMLDIVYNNVADERFMYILGHDSSCIDIDDIVRKLLSNRLPSEEINRFGVQKLSWDAMMKPVIQYYDTKIVKNSNP